MAAAVLTPIAPFLVDGNCTNDESMMDIDFGLDEELEENYQMLSSITPSPLSSMTPSPLSSMTPSPTSSTSTAPGSPTTKKSPAPKPVLSRCRVCGDEASGIHYGVTSCEGCKGFFRRCIGNKTLIVQCQKEGSCDIAKTTRGRCAHCRYQKCLAVGMSIHSVRVGRYSKKQKQKNLAEIESLSTQEKVREREEKDRKMYALIQKVVAAHESTCFKSNTQAHVKLKQITYNSTQLDSLEVDLSMLAAQNGLRSHIQHSINTQELYAQVCSIKTFQTEILTPAVVNVVQFSKSLLGFCDLLQEDQMTLLKAGFFEIWLVRVASQITISGSEIDFGTGEPFHLSHLHCMGREQMFWEELFDFVRGFNSLQLIKEEVALFTAVLMLSADRYGLKEVSKVEKLQEQFVECMRREVTRRDWKNKQLFARLLMQITALRSVSMLFNKSANDFRRAWPYVEVPPLLEEILDYEY